MSAMDRFVRWLTGEEGEDGETTPAREAAPDATSRPGRSARGNGLPPVENNATDYGVTIEEAQVEPGTQYWRAVRVYHLSPQENGGKHHIFLDALTPDGKRAFNSQAHITWEGGEHTVAIDKPLSEPGANFPMWKWQVCALRMLGMPSDTVRNLRTDHPDEPNPDGSTSGNTLFHHSFLVEFQQVTAPAQTGAILGRVENSRNGLTAELLRAGSVVARADVSESGTFSFADVRPGQYEVRLDDQRQPVVVTGGETTQIVLTLTPHQSVIEGTIHNGGGLLLRLVSEGEVLAEGELGQSGTFRLRNLGPATYFIHVVRPGAVEPVVTSNALVMDGTNTRRVELTIPTQGDGAVGSPFRHYVLFGDPGQQSTRAHLTVLAPVLAEKRLAFGFDMHEASLADQVTAIGDGHAVSEFALIYLATKGVRVRRLTGSPEEIRTVMSNE